MFKIGRKDNGFSRKLEVLDLKFEINSAKVLRLEERVENFEKRLTNVEISNRKLAEAVMNLVEILRNKEMEGKTRNNIATRRFAQRAQPKRGERSIAQASHAPLEDQILDYLKNNGPSTPTQMQAVFKRSREHISRTLKVLSERGAVERRKEGKTFVYSLLAEPSKEGFEESQPDV